jgi:polyhydroxyalkanoate synthase subunit PhaC
VTEWLDEARRGIGRACDAIGFGAQETPYRVAANFRGGRLRAYFRTGDTSGPVLLIIPAPYKRPYIWDISPDLSVVRRCVGKGLRVYLLEWLAPTKAEDSFGLAEYAFYLPAAALQVIEAQTGVSTSVLAGHSLGGTFAAIFAALDPDRVAGLVLVDAPLAFGEHGGSLTRAIKMLPHAHHLRNAIGSPVPGSLINLLAVVTAPEVFQLQRLADLGASLAHPETYALHLRMERWACDELPMAGQLFEETLEQLYREDRFLNGTLEVAGRRADPKHLRSPVAAIVNPPGRIVPPASILKALEAVPGLSVEVFVYQEERGPMLQHLGPLVAPGAHKLLWPRLLDWIGVHIDRGAGDEEGDICSILRDRTIRGRSRHRQPNSGRSDPGLM